MNMPSKSTLDAIGNVVHRSRGELSARSDAVCCGSFLRDWSLQVVQVQPLQRVLAQVLNLTLLVLSSRVSPSPIQHKPLLKYQNRHAHGSRQS